jgi:nicotinamide-nucleotide amidase
VPRRPAPDVLTAELITASADPAGTAAGAAVAVGRVLEREGCPVRGRHVVPADEESVLRALRQAVDRGGLVVALGEEGEGGTALRQALGRLLGGRLVLSDRALEALAGAYAARGQAMPRRAEQLGLVPQGATVLVAPERGEPGLAAELGSAVLAVLPGVPSAALALVRAHVLPRLTRADAGPQAVLRTLRLLGVDLVTAETRVSSALRGIEGVSAQVLDTGEDLWVRLRARGDSRKAAEAMLDALEPALRGAFGVAWYGVDDETLEVVVGRLLRRRGWTVALAESCTGGLLGHRLTQVPGSSAYFERGVVVYSNEAKQALLGVPEAVLREHGAVSAACVEAMARGARERAGTDVGLAVTGIAGPEGGTPTKPVGTVFLGLADARGAVVERHRFDRDREGNKALSAVYALDLLRRRCLETP